MQRGFRVEDNLWRSDPVCLPKLRPTRPELRVNQGEGQRITRNLERFAQICA